MLRILSELDVAQAPRWPGDPSFRTHLSKGDLAGHWSIWVNGNWRVTFRFRTDLHVPFTADPVLIAVASTDSGRGPMADLAITAIVLDE